MRSKELIENNLQEVKSKIRKIIQYADSKNKEVKVSRLKTHTL